MKANDFKTDYLGQVCALCTFITKLGTLDSYTLDCCLGHFKSKDMSKYHITTSHLLTSKTRYTNFQISNHQWII